MKKDTLNLSVSEEFAIRMNLENKRNKVVSIAPLIILITLLVLMALFVEGFFTVANFSSILNQLAIPLIISVGLTFVIIMGSIDLSVTGLMGFVGSIVCLMVVNTKTQLNLGVLAMLISAAAGTAVGFVSGLIHVKTKLPSFMVTFAVSSIMTGFGVLTYRGEPAMVYDPMFTALSQGSFLGIPIITWGALVVFGIGYALQEFTAFGKHIYAIGDNETVLRNTGVKVDRIKILVFTFSGLCIAIAGIVGAIRVSRGEVLIGRGNLFPSITAVVVGGTALSGGSGGVVNSLIGSMIVVIIQDALILLGVDPYIQAAVQGLIIIIAVSLSVARGKKLIVK